MTNNSYSRLPLTVILTIVVLLGIGGAVYTALRNSDQTKIASSSGENPNARQVHGTLTILQPGDYVGGTDIPVGIYEASRVTKGDSGSFHIHGDKRYTVDEILGVDGEPDSSPRVRTVVLNGIQIRIGGEGAVLFKPVTSPYSTTRSRTTLHSGAFVVGQDIGAGPYRATPGEGFGGVLYVVGTDGKTKLSSILDSTPTSGEVGFLDLSLAEGETVNITGIPEVKFTPVD
jgi:hypothetical protein